MSGAAKLRRPAPAASALVAARLPSSTSLVRILGAAEIAIGVLVLLRPAPVASLLLAAAFAALAAVAAVFVRNPEVASCGCFGEDAPATWAHVILDLAACGIALVAAVDAPESLPETLRGLGWASLPFLAGVCCIVYLARATATLLPEALSAYRGQPHEHDRPRTGRHRHARTEDALRAEGIAEGHPSLWGEQAAGASAR